MVAHLPLVFAQVLRHCQGANGNFSYSIIFQRSARGLEGLVFRV
jgi:hypothetical protein